MGFKFSLLIFLLLWAASAALSQDSTKSFDVENGFGITPDQDQLIFYTGGTVDPRTGGGVPAPMGSVFRRTNADTFIKTGVGDADWTLDGLGSAVVTQTGDFGKSGNAAANAFLNRAGNIPSNVSGIPIMVSVGAIKSVSCGQEDIATYDIEIYEHEGDFVNATLLFTLTVTAARSGSAHGLNISVTQDNQLAAKTLDNVKNVGCTVAMKGLSL